MAEFVDFVLLWWISKISRTVPTKTKKSTDPLAGGNRCPSEEPQPASAFGLDLRASVCGPTPRLCLGMTPLEISPCWQVWIKYAKTITKTAVHNQCEKMSF